MTMQLRALVPALVPAIGPGGAAGGGAVLTVHDDIVAWYDGVRGERWRARVPGLTDAMIIGGVVWCASLGQTRVVRFDLEGAQLEPLFAPEPLGHGRWNGSPVAASGAWCGEGAVALRSNGSVALRGFAAAAPVLEGRWLVWRAGSAVMVHAIGEVWSTAVDHSDATLVDVAVIAEGRLIALVIRSHPQDPDLRLVVMDSRVGEVMTRLVLAKPRRVRFAAQRAAAVVHVDGELEVIDLRFGRCVRQLTIDADVQDLLVDAGLQRIAMLREPGAIEFVTLAALALPRGATGSVAAGAGLAPGAAATPPALAAPQPVATGPQATAAPPLADASAAIAAPSIAAPGAVVVTPPPSVPVMLPASGMTGPAAGTAVPTVAAVVPPLAAAAGGASAAIAPAAAAMTAVSWSTTAADPQWPGLSPRVRAAGTQPILPVADIAPAAPSHGAPDAEFADGSVVAGGPELESAAVTRPTAAPEAAAPERRSGDLGALADRFARARALAGVDAAAALSAEGDALAATEPQLAGRRAASRPQIANGTGAMVAVPAVVDRADPGEPDAARDAALARASGQARDGAQIGAAIGIARAMPAGAGERGAVLEIVPDDTPGVVDDAASGVAHAIAADRTHAMAVDAPATDLVGDQAGGAAWRASAGPPAAPAAAASDGPVPARVFDEADLATLTAISRGFRGSYLDHDAITAQLQAWVAAFPELCRLTSLARSPEGRDVWLLVVGRDPDRPRPAVWVGGNRHPIELAGSSVALAIAEDAIRIHLAPDSLALSTTVIDRLRDVLFYIVPRLVPDGAEAVLRSGRAAPRPTAGAASDARRVGPAGPRWIAGDVDGDGLALAMRVADPGGEFVEALELPGVLVPRTLDDEGPFYKVFPEGMIEGFDGRRVPPPALDPAGAGGSLLWAWPPMREHARAGGCACDDGDIRAVTEFAAAHPEIFAWLDLHTFGGMAMRMPRAASGSAPEPSDLAIFDQLAAWTTEHARTPTVTGDGEHGGHRPGIPHGELSEFAYRERGAIGYAAELWDVRARLGIAASTRRTRVSRADLLAVARWDREVNAGFAFPAWQAHEHPQLGDVEVGGVDPRIGIWNPPLTEIDRICDAQVSVLLRLAALAPRLRVDRVERRALGGGLTRVDVRIANDGYLGSYVLPSASALPFNEPVHATARGDGCELLDTGDRQVLGHLDGWGPGRDSADDQASDPGACGANHAAWASYLVRGQGAIELRVGSCRVGFLTIRIAV